VCIYIYDISSPRLNLQQQFKSVVGDTFIPRLLFEMEVCEIKFDVTCSVHVLIFNI